MPYTNLIFFFLSLLIYATYIPNNKGTFISFLLSFSMLTVGYYLFTWITYRHYRRKFEKEPYNAINISQIIGTLEKNFILFALFLYLYLVYTAGLKNIIWRISLLKESALIDLTAGLFPFLLFLMILWSNSFNLFKAFTDIKTDRKTYLLSHIRMNAPILLPVFFFSLLQDIFRLLSVKGFDTSEILSYSELIWFIPFLILLIVFYPLVIKFIWGCYPLAEGPRRKKLEEYCHKSGLKISGIFLWPILQGKSLTAGITGIIGKLRYFFITPALLNVLNDDEMGSVIAHEAGHVKRKHMYYYVLLFMGFPLCFFLISDLLSLALYGFADFITQYTFGWSFDSNFLSLAILFFFTVFILLYLRIFFGILSRNFERQADLFVFEVVGHPLNLISSLEKISHYGGNIKNIPNWHHFSIGQRIKFLQDCQMDKHQIEIHQKRVKRIKISLISFVTVTLLLLGGLNHSQIRQAIKLNLMEGQVRRVMANNPQSVDLQLALADILLEKKEYHQAEPIYQQIIRVSPNNVTALNNLAWLYATSEDTRLRDKKKALALAQKAADLKQEPFILDTLAEAYFINGKQEKALQTIEAAIALQPDNLDYYLRQKQKFIGKGGR